MTQANYLDQLAAWIEERPLARSRQDAATVAFLAVRADVSAALDAGYNLVSIHAHMKDSGRISMSYETFRAHARKLVRPKSASQPRPRQPASPTDGGTPGPVSSGAPRSSQSPRSLRSPSGSPPPAMAGFDFNATPDKKDLF